METMLPLNQGAKEFKYSWSDRVFASVIQVRCRKICGELHKKKFGSGSKGKCIKYKEEWMTPSEFEAKCGLLSSKDWKRSLHCEGRKLCCLIEDGIIEPHSKACVCSLCCDDTTPQDQPVRYFIQRKRKIKVAQEKTKKYRLETNTKGELLGVKGIPMYSKTCQKRNSYKSRVIQDEVGSIDTRCTLDAFDECLGTVLTKTEELKRIAKHLREDFDRKLLAARQDLEREKNREIEAIRIKSKLLMDKKVADEKQLMDIRIQEAMAQIRQEMTEKFNSSK